MSSFFSLWTFFLFLSSVLYDIYSYICVLSTRQKYSLLSLHCIKLVRLTLTQPQNPVMTPTAITVKDEVTLKTPIGKAPLVNTHEDDDENDIGEDEVGEEVFATGE
jgi:hypothetical protein